MLLVSLMAIHNLRGCAADIGHAFMHSPLTSKVPIVLKLPLSVSLVNGEPAFLHLSAALNGLRDASQAWLSLLSSLILPLGLAADSREPCFFSGCLWPGGRAMVLCYVDDILLATTDEAVELAVLNAIRSRVEVKVTGHLMQDQGGSVTFIGRTLRRWPGCRQVEVFVRESYLDPCWEAYQINKGSSTYPNIANLLEQSSGSKPLTPEAYSRFRRALGKILWLAQTRQDIKFAVGLPSTQQSQPTQCTESGLRALLRYLFEDRSLVLRLPSDELTLDFLACDQDSLYARLHVFTDASHAPYRCLGRKGVSGGAMCYAGCLIRAVAKVQGVVSLSSCEAELHALQYICQESVGLNLLIARVVSSMGSQDVHVITEAHVGQSEDTRETGADNAESGITTDLITDSQSAIDLLNGQDLPRQSRHIEIRVAWMRAKMSSGSVNLRWLAGTMNPADLFTKNVNTSLLQMHRARLGFVVVQDVPQGLFQLALGTHCRRRWPADGGVRIALLEVCCAEESGLSKACHESNVPYAGVTRNMQMGRVFASAFDVVKIWRKQGHWIHVHVSTPCSSGSPLKRFQSGECEPTVADFEWEGIMRAAGKYLMLGDGRSFELPRYNHIWERYGTQQVLEKASLSHRAVVYLCRTGMVGKSGNPVGKQLQFMSTHKSFAEHLHKCFGTCECVGKHAAFNDVEWPETGFYNQKLARGIIAAMQAL